LKFGVKKDDIKQSMGLSQCIPSVGLGLYCGTAYFLSLDAKQAQILRNERQKKIAKKCINIGLLR
jgi:hypothetical protein